MKGKRVAVIYDSQTGNTRKVAEAMAKETGAELFPVQKAPANLENYDFVFIGTPDIRAKPAQRMADFLVKAQPPKQYALFMTYGMPIWGIVSSSLCSMGIRKLLKRAVCRGFFRCPGYHHKYRHYPGRPDEDDLKRASEFSRRCVA